MRIRVDYEQLQAIAREFAQHAEEIDQFSGVLLNHIENLRSGAWVGVGANAFYQEMDDLVIPAFRALKGALDETHSVTTQVIRALQEMEDDAAHLLMNDGRTGVTNQPAPAAKNPLVTELTIPAGAVSPQQYGNFIDSLNVEGNQRYAKFHDNNPNTYDTYCNLFAADVAARMNAPLPLYVTDEHGKVTQWLGATNMKEWLDGSLKAPGSYTQGPQNGWIKVDTATAVKYANQGYVTVAAGYGHMAVVRPGNNPSAGTGDVVISQAGENNFNKGPLKNGWGSHVNTVNFYVHVPK